ncbi:MAG TPA: SPFH domain-containing protein [Ktedonobacteraceae bacterium]|nr:SPFH domain-containing protein [Ktedonobacteraceae bacterium]
MTLEQDNSRASSSWSDSNTVSWDSDPLLMDLDDPLTPPLQDDQISPPPVDTSALVDEEEWVKPPLFSRDSLFQLARQLSPVLVPLPFALLIFLFTLPSDLKSSPHIPVVILALVLLALVVIQGTFLYYAGSNDSLWTLYTVLGYVAFLLVGAFAIFGLGGALLLFIVLLVIGFILGGRAIRQVPEGHADLVFSFSSYQRTLFPGLNFILPWEKIQGRLNTQETTWTSPAVRVNISRDQDVEIVATLTYQLVPEDAHMAILNMKNWEETLHQHFIGTMKSMVKELSPSDFVAWSHHVNDRAAGIEVDPFIDATTMTRWDRFNVMLKRRLQDQMAMRGILVNLVHIQDITVIPHLAPVSSPPPGMQSRPAEAAPVDTGVARGASQAPRPAASYPVAAPTAAPAPLPPVSLPPPKPDVFDAMIDMYNSVREGRVTDTTVILDLAARFNAIASHPEISQQFNWDSARAANNLYQRAQALKTAEAQQTSEPDVTTEMKRPARRPMNENLAAGG